MGGSSIDIFGRSSKGRAGKQGERGIGFNLTPEGNFDLRKKRVCNAANPVDEQDVATKSFVHHSLNHRTSIDNKNNTFSIKKKRLIDVNDPVNPSDAVTKSFLQNKALLLEANNEVFDARNKRLGNVGAAASLADAVNLKYLHDNSICKVEATLLDPKTKVESKAFVFNANKLSIDNMGPPATGESAVPWGFLENCLRHLTMSLMHEIADSAIALRKEIYYITRSAKKRPELETHLNSIESSINRTWRSALEMEDKPRKSYSWDERIKARLWSDKLYE